MRGAAMRGDFLPTDKFRKTGWPSDPVATDEPGKVMRQHANRQDHRNGSSEDIQEKLGESFAICFVGRIIRRNNGRQHNDRLSANANVSSSFNVTMIQ
jgi:hypothetical protein